MMKELQFGIEIETVGLSRDQMVTAIQRVIGGSAHRQGSGWRIVGRDGRTWKVVADDSLASFQSGEIVSPILRYEDIETLQEIIRSVRRAGAKADESCGIHIHVDGERFNGKALGNLVKIIYRQEELLHHALGIGHRRSRYCQRIDTGFYERMLRRRARTCDALNAAWYGQHTRSPHRYDSSRYHGLNLNSFFFRGTIEFRYFNGTLHAGKVKAYLQLVLALAAKALGARSAASKRKPFSPATAKYDLRIFLLSLGLNGEEFKTARLHLTKHLGGSAAWKGERRDRGRERSSATATQESDTALRAAA